MKVLDFGLGKTFGDAAPAADLSDSPTAAYSATGAGVVLGTASYMSPEQARGRQVDARTDVWSFGCVAYETLTGKKAFSGETATDVLAAVVSGEPDWSALPADVPARARAVIEKCLRKDPARRIRAVADAWLELEEAREAKSGRPAGRRPLAAFASGAVLSALLVGATLYWARPGAGPRTPKRFLLQLPELPGPFDAAAISRDGASIVYAGRQEDDARKLFLRPLERENPAALEGTDGAYGNPFFSPEGDSLVFYAPPELKIVPLSGGVPRTLARVEPPFFGGSWSKEAGIVFSTGKSISRIAPSGSEPEVLFTAEEGEEFWRPVVLPEKHALLFGSTSRSGWSVSAARVEPRERRILIEDGTNAVYLPTGHLVFKRDSSIYAAPFDAHGLELLGSPQAVVDGVASNPYTPFSISDEGTLLYREPNVNVIGLSRLVWVDRDGKVSPLNAPPQRFIPHPRLSPDGRKVVVAISNLPFQDVWVLDIARGAFSRVTTPTGARGLSLKPHWSGDGRRVLFSSDVGVAPLHFAIFSQSPDRSDVTQLTTGPFRVATSVSSRGNTILFRQQPDGNSRDRDIGMMPLDGSEEPRLLLHSRFDEHSAVLSPDDRLMAYVSNESGRQEVYVRRFPGMEGRTLISTDGGTEPLWSRDGEELFYRSGDRMMAVRIVATDSEIVPSAPRLLFEGRFQSEEAGSTNYDVDEDGHFLMIQEDEAESGVATYRIVLHWTEELKRLVPVLR